MRIPTIALCSLLLPSIIFCQDHAGGHDRTASTVAQQYNFPGAVALQITIDSMTDKTFCFASIESDMVAIDVSGKSAANLGTPSDIDYEKPAMLRIDNDPPIPLNIQHQKHQFLFRGTATRQLQIPQERVEEFVRALYTRQRLRLRYATFPGPGNYDADVKFGDFAAAYDRGVQLCAWPTIRAAASHPSAEEIADLMFPGTEAAPPAEEPAPDPLGFYVDAIARILTTNWTAVRGTAPSAGSAALAFAIDKTGGVDTLPIAYTDLERACVSAVRASNPFPALPPGRDHRLALHAECSGDSVKVSRLD